MFEDEVDLHQMCQWATTESIPKGKPGATFEAMSAGEFRLLTAALRTLHIDGHVAEGDIRQLLSQEAASRSSEPCAVPLVVREQADGDLCVMTDTLQVVVGVQISSRKRQTWSIASAWKVQTSFKQTQLQHQMKD
jgi:hypothetical protein